MLYQLRMISFVRILRNCIHTQISISEMTSQETKKIANVLSISHVARLFTATMLRTHLP